MNSRSRMKPKVRARLISLRKHVVEKSIVARLSALLEDRVIELDLEIHFEAVVRLEARPLVAIATSIGARIADEALRRGLLLDARRLQQEHEGAGAAIHDRHFFGGQIDVRVVDAQARERGHQMFDRGDAGLPLIRVVPSMVSPTFSAWARHIDDADQDRCGEKPRRYRRRWLTTISTFLPECSPTPVARMLFLRVR